MKTVTMAGIVLTLLATTGIAKGTVATEAELVGRATLPGKTEAKGPVAGSAIQEAYAAQNISPSGQPVQGFSAILPTEDGTYLVLMDNGFGSKGNSADVHLRWYNVRPDFDSGQVEVLDHTQLRDPRGHIPFPIVNDDGDRVLTGADFDPESFQRASDGTIWVGEEFGPFLLQFDAQGILLQPPVAASVPSAWARHSRGSSTLRSPQHPDFVSLEPADASAKGNVGGSKGFEGLALLPPGDRMLAMLEAPLLDHPQRAQVPLLEFQPGTSTFTGRYWVYPLDDPGHAIGSVQAINERELLVLERDDRAGDEARFKQVHRVTLDDTGQGGLLAKELVVDLLSLRDSRGFLSAPVYLSFGLPFITLESMLIVDRRTLLVVNDNNFPFRGKDGSRPDDTAFALIRLPQPLDLKRPENWPRALALPAPGAINLEGLTPSPDRQRHAVQLTELWRPHRFGPDPRGITLDLGDSTLSGRVFTAAFHDEGNLSLLGSQWRAHSRVEKGRCLLPINEAIDSVGPFAQGDQGVLAYRLDLIRMGADGPRPAGFVDSRIYYRREESGFAPMLSIVEGPIVADIHSDRLGQCVVAFETDRPAQGSVEILGRGISYSFGGPSVRALRHEILVTGLQPAKTYRYRVAAEADGETARTPWFTFDTAPPPGQGPIRFVFAGDSRRSYGGGEAEYLGVNRRVLTQVIRGALEEDVDFLLFGGDLITGNVSSEEDFVTELKAFKQVALPLLTSRPFYTAIGNHESLQRVFRDANDQWVWMDRWPYRSSSAEALFAREMIHPTNGPSDPPGLPPYRETIFSLRFGPVQVLVCNNNYWYTRARAVETHGGNPQGYLLDDQLQWIEDRLALAENDPTVSAIFLTMQEPVFPNGGHTRDGMWYSGDNRVRAKRFDDSDETKVSGLIEVRNRFWRAVAGSSKVAAVLCSDEHNYHRTLIGSGTPTGVMKDDRDGNGVLDDGRFSGNDEFRQPTWSIVSGGAGAPYYIREPTPWGEAVARFSTKHHYLVIEVDEGVARLEARSIDGEILDEVSNLLEVKNP